MFQKFKLNENDLIKYLSPKKQDEIQTEDEIINKGYTLYKSGDFENANTYLSQILSFKNSEKSIYYAFSLTMMGKWAHAILVYDQLIENAVSDELLIMRGNLWLIVGNVVKGWNDFDKVFAIDLDEMNQLEKRINNAPQSIKSIISIAKLHEARGFLELMHEWKLVKSGTVDEQCIINLWECLKSRYSYAFEIDQENIAACHNHGVILLFLNRWEEALADLEWAKILNETQLDVKRLPIYFDTMPDQNEFKIKNEYVISTCENLIKSDDAHQIRQWLYVKLWRNFIV